MSKKWFLVWFEYHCELRLRIGDAYTAHMLDGTKLKDPRYIKRVKNYMEQANEEFRKSRMPHEEPLRNLVIAGSYAQFIEWIRSNYYDQKKYEYVDNHEKLRGVQVANIIRIGQYWINPVEGSQRLRWIEENTKMAGEKR